MFNSKSMLTALLTVGVFLAVFLSRQNVLLSNFIYSSDTVRNQLSQVVQLSSSYVDQMSIVGEAYFRLGTRLPHPYLDQLKASADGTHYSMDAVRDMGLTDSLGNITGIGPLFATEAQRENLGLALVFNPHFKAVYDALPGIAWVYYTGQEGFINLYPWVPSDVFQFAPEEMARPFYDLVKPANNPEGLLYWTPVYLDGAGKGLMVTVSKPVYGNNRFRGVVSLDYTLTRLTELMDPQYHSLLVNDSHQVLAGTRDEHLIQSSILTLDEYLEPDLAHRICQICHSQSNRLSTAQGQYVYATPIHSAPWTLVSMIPQWQVLLSAFAYSSPVLLIGCLLMLSYHAYDKTLKTESVLTATVKDLEKSRRQLEDAAAIDFLTGALNRRSMTERLHEEVSRNSRYGSRFTLAMGDLDHFKSFNDRYGHAAGDMVLMTVVQCIKEHIRSADLLSRWGGEEFLLMLPDTPEDEARAAAENLRKVIEDLRFTWESETDLKITMTFGISEYDPAKGLDRSIIQADDALYHAKLTGRNRVCSFKELD